MKNLLSTFVACYLIAVPCVAQEKLKKGSTVPWLDKSIPSQIKRLIPPQMNIIRCGIAPYGQRGATKWVVAWTPKLKKQSHWSFVTYLPVTIALFSSDKGHFTKSKEHTFDNIDTTWPISLYWLNETKLQGQIIQFGNAPTRDGGDSTGMGTLIAFTQGWNGKFIRQDITPDRFGEHFTSYEFPFIDNRGLFCIKRYLDDIVSQEEAYRIEEATLRWDGTGWHE